MLLIYKKYMCVYLSMDNYWIDLYGWPLEGKGVVFGMFVNFYSFLLCCDSYGNCIFSFWFESVGIRCCRFCVGWKLEPLILLFDEMMYPWPCVIRIPSDFALSHSGRIGYSMITDAEEKGIITPGKVSGFHVILFFMESTLTCCSSGF